MTLLADNTADTTDLATASFTSSIDSTYKLYIFKFLDINPATDNVEFGFQGNAASGSGYDETITASYFHATHTEADGVDFNNDPAQDQAQATGFQSIAHGLGNGGDESCAGILWLFNPSNTTYVKHFYSRMSGYMDESGIQDCFAGGYFNTTSAIDAIQFKMSSGNFDGTIKMYGVG